MITKKLEDRLALGLGFFSIGLGLAELLVPRNLAKATGVKREKEKLLRAFGVREVLTGFGILSQRKMANWMWARVIGDVVDATFLGRTALVSRRKKRNKALAALAAVAGVTALDVFCSHRLSQRTDLGTKAIRIRKSIIIGRSAEDLYEFWHHFNRLGIIMNHLESVTPIDRNVWHWVAKVRGGLKLVWDAEVTEDIPNHLIAWRSLPGADVDNWGVVRFEPAVGGRGTIVRVDLSYSPPTGVFGAKVAKLFGEAPDQQINVDLRRFKQLMETGEIARTEGQPAGRRKSTSIHDELVRH